MFESDQLPPFNVKVLCYFSASFAEPFNNEKGHWVV